MPRIHDAIPPPVPRGGINRFDTEARPDQAVEALDVVNDDGDVRRRDGFTSIMAAAPHLLPAGLADVIVGIGSIPPSGTPTTWADRAGTLTSFHWLLVGSTEQFDALDVREVTRTGTPSSTPGHMKVRLDYSIDDGSGGLAFARVPFVLDRTREIPSATYGTPMGKNGRISWHRSSIASAWVSKAYNSLTRYWMLVRPLRQSTGDAAMQWNQMTGTTIVIAAPGIRVGILPRVNGLFPVRLKGGRLVIVIGTDRFPARGSEQGAQLSCVRHLAGEADEQLLVEDEGGGLLGLLTWPAIERNAGAGWVSSQASAGAYGNIGQVITKTRDKNYGTTDTPYDWWVHQWIGSALLSGLQAISPDTTVNQLVITAPASMAFDANRLEHHQIVVTTSGGVSTIDPPSEIKSATQGGGVWRLNLYPPLSATPTAPARFSLMRPPAKVRIIGDSAEYAANESDAQTISLNADGKLQPIAPNVNRCVHFEVGWPLRWQVPSSPRWCSAYDTISGELVLTNGLGPMLTFDGKRLRKLAADTTSANALNYVNKLPDDPVYTRTADTNPQSVLRAVPPRGRFVVDYRGRLVVGGIPGYPNVIQWSGYGNINNVWPKQSEVAIRDSESHPLAGLATIGDRLIAFTTTSIHQLYERQVGELYINLVPEPVSRGLGFLAHAAVVACPLDGRDVLIGPAGDGVYAWSAGDPMPILDRWDRVLDGGVNDRALGDVATAAALFSRQQFWIAVPGRGSSTANRILVYDWIRRAWWAYSAPFGVGFLASDRDRAGHEVMLIGTTDGHVMTPLNVDTDDGTTVTGRARGRPLQPYGGGLASLSSLLVTGRELGSQETMGLRLYVDRDQVAVQDASLTLDWGSAVYDGTARYGTAAWAADRYDTIRANIPTAGGNHRCHQVQVEMRGSSRWRLRGLELLARVMGRRGRHAP